MLRIAVFASGRGSNLRAIVDAIEAGTIPDSRVFLVISNNSNAGALELARARHIDAVHLSRQHFDSDAAFNEAMLAHLRKRDINLIALAGYMKKLDSHILNEYSHQVINIHPALLPDFGGQGMYGMRVHESVIATKSPRSGATVHLVTDEYDRGPVLMQRSVNVDPTDTPELLAEKILRVEHELYPEVIRMIATGELRLPGLDLGGRRE